MRTVLERAGGPYSVARRKAIGVLFLSASLLACTGRIGDADTRQPANSGRSSTDSGGGSGSGSSGGSGSGSSAGSGVGSPTADCSSASPGSSPIRRLTRFEYSNSVRDLLGDTTRAGDLLPPEQKGNGFSNDAASLTTPPLLVDAYNSVAHDIASRAVKDSTTLARIAPCNTATLGEDACSQQFVDGFGSKAFRRPLDGAEHAALLRVYASGKSGAAHVDGLAAVIEMVLQSPQFLYRIEVGTPVANTTVARPTSYEMASRLSYLLWGSLPDTALLDAVQAGQLDTKDQVLAQATRMLGYPRAR